MDIVYFPFKWSVLCLPLKFLITIAKWITVVSQWTAWSYLTKCYNPLDILGKTSLKSNEVVLTSS